jgi:hypothetical protein
LRPISSARQRIGWGRVHRLPPICSIRVRAFRKAKCRECSRA